MKEYDRDGGPLFVNRINQLEVFKVKAFNEIDNPVHEDANQDRQEQANGEPGRHHKNSKVDHQDDVEEEDGPALVQVADSTFSSDDLIFKHHEADNNGDKAINNASPNVLIVYDLIELLIEESWLVE